MKGGNRRMNRYSQTQQTIIKSEALAATSDFASTNTWRTQPPGREVPALATPLDRSPSRPSLRPSNMGRQNH